MLTEVVIDQHSSPDHVVNAVGHAVTALFVPGHRADRIANAVRSDADLVIIDLEDAVPLDQRPAALRTVVHLLGAGGTEVRAAVRINALGTPAAAEDVAALERILTAPDRGTRSGLVAVMVAKAEDARALAGLTGQLRQLGEALPTSVPTVPLIETALGLVRLTELASVDAVARLAFGALDFGLDLAAEEGSNTLAFARAQVVIASRAAGLPAPLDSPSTEIRNLDQVNAAARTARADGFGGQLCIHPAQLSAVRSAFEAGPEELSWARRVMAAADGAVQLDGRMIDRPVVERARRILARASNDRLDH